MRCDPVEIQESFHKRDINLLIGTSQVIEERSNEGEEDGISLPRNSLVKHESCEDSGSIDQNIEIFENYLRDDLSHCKSNMHHVSNDWLLL